MGWKDMGYVLHRTVQTALRRFRIHLLARRALCHLGTKPGQQNQARLSSSRAATDGQPGAAFEHSMRCSVRNSG